MNVTAYAKDLAMLAAGFAVLVFLNRLVVKPNAPAIAAYLPGGQ